MSTTQPKIFTKQKAELIYVPLSAILPPEDKVAGSAKASISSLGMLSAMLLKRENDAAERFNIIDGAGRYLSAVEDGLESVPAMVLAADTNDADLAALTAAMNLARRPNLAHEAAALDTLYVELTRTGMVEADITRYLSKTLGISATTVKQRLKLLELPHDLKQGVLSGQIKRGVAAKVANLTPGLQAKVNELYKETGNLSADDVHELRQASKQAVMEELPDALFDMPDTDPLMMFNANLKTLLEEGRASGVDAAYALQVVEDFFKEVDRE